MTLRARLAEQQRLLDRAEVPSWAHHGVPALAVVLGTVAIVDNARSRTWSTDPPDSSLPASLLIALAVAPWVVTWVGRQRHSELPLDELLFAALVIAPLAVLNLGGESLGISELDSWGPQFSLMLLILVACQTAAYARPWVVAGVQVAVLAVITGRAVLSGQFDQWYIWIVAAAVLGLGGLAMRANCLAMERLREAQDELARQALADERRRVAREVHDTVAHTLSVTMLHLTAARLAVERAPDRAAAALEEAERQGRAGMGDIRRIVRLLRTDDEDAADLQVRDLQTVPALTIERALPTIDELPELLASYEAAGLAVTYTCTSVAPEGIGGRDCDHDHRSGSSAGNGAAGDDSRLAATVDALPPSVGLALFRVAQESLANAAKHGDGDAAVRLCVADDAVTLTVCNRCRDDAVPRPGMGLIGMRERVAGLGGDFRAGPAPHVGHTARGSANGSAVWEVAARIPTGAGL